MNNMIEMNNTTNQKTLDLVVELSKELLGKNDLYECAKKCNVIYASTEYRHSYSEITNFIVGCLDNGEQESIECLTANITEIKSIVESDDKEFSGIYEPVFKLWDHIQLEASRVSVYIQSTKDQERLKSEIEAAQTRLEAFKKVTDSGTDLNSFKNEMNDNKARIKESNARIVKANIELRNLQGQMVSVLGIFSAVIVAFFGGFNFITSALASLNSFNFLGTIFIVTICGIILLNVVFMLMYFIGKISGRNICAECTSEYCDCSKKCSGINRIRKRLPYVFWMNILLFLILAVDCVVLVTTTI